MTEEEVMIAACVEQIKAMVAACEVAGSRLDGCSLEWVDEKSFGLHLDLTPIVELPMPSVSLSSTIH